jgi:predicted ATPase
LETITQRLTQEPLRLLTLIGPAGVGKTRLALEAGSRLSDQFPDGVTWVNLAPIREPELVLPTVAQTLGLMDSGPRPLLERLQEYLHERNTLLILDNVEQVLPSAGEIAELLAATADLRILITSRVPLRLRWEHTLRIAPLAVPASDAAPSLQELVQFPSVALFVERAQAQRADFDPTEGQVPLLIQLARHLDGLPLAIELAAGQMSVLPLAVIASRMDQRVQMLRWDAQDLPDRQRSLQAAIGWSYDLLTEAEQRLFRHLGVFVGLVSLNAIDAVAGNADADLTLEGLAALAEKSLVLPGQPEEDDPEPAFVLLDTMRQFASSSSRHRTSWRRQAEPTRSTFCRWQSEPSPNCGGEARWRGAAGWSPSTTTCGWRFAGCSTGGASTVWLVTRRCVWPVRSATSGGYGATIPRGRTG